MKIDVEKAWRSLLSINYTIHPKHGQSYISNDEYDFQLNNISILRKNKAISVEHRLVLKTVLDSGLRHKKELEDMLRNQPRIDAQKFIGNKKIRNFIFNRDGNKCLICGSENKLSIDHIESVNKGGLNRISNLQTLCTSCNSRKSDSYADYRNNKNK